MEAREMKKEIIHRIAYYTRKVAERSSLNLAEKLPRSYTYRHKRLMAYKKLMHKQIQESGY
jgi:hypothetical protein